MSVTAPPRLEREYVSPMQLEQIFPYSHKTWYRWYHEGRLPGCLRPFGKRGRLLIPLSEARRLLRRGPGALRKRRGSDRHRENERSKHRLHDFLLADLSHAPTFAKQNSHVQCTMF